jgi:hypothetical protein
MAPYMRRLAFPPLGLICCRVPSRPASTFGCRGDSDAEPSPTCLSTQRHLAARIDFYEFFIRFDILLHSEARHSREDLPLE